MHHRAGSDPVDRISNRSSHGLGHAPFYRDDAAGREVEIVDDPVELLHVALAEQESTRQQRTHRMQPRAEAAVAHSLRKQLRRAIRLRHHLQRLPRVTRLPACLPSRALLGSSRRRRRLAVAIARRRLVAVAAVLVQPGLQLREAHRERGNLPLKIEVGRHQGLLTHRPHLRFCQHVSSLPDFRPAEQLLRFVQS